MKTIRVLFIALLLLLSVSNSFSQVGAEMVININSSSFSGPHNLFSYNDSLWFVDNNGVVGDEFWVSDGTQSGSRLWFDLSVGGSSDAYNLLTFNDKLIFVASDLANHDFLYSTDGTSGAVTKLEGPISSTTPAPTEFILFNNLMIFAWDSAAVGEELWRSDGTSQGTYLLKDIRPGADDSEPEDFVMVNNVLYFIANDGTGKEVWKTDGTTAGTVMVADINPTGHSLPAYLTSHNGFLFFAAGDGTNEYALYKTNGVTTTKIAVPDNTNTWGNVGIKDIVSFNGYVFFMAYDNQRDFELWRSDGTMGGTALFLDIDTTHTMVNPGGHPQGFTVVGNKLFFSAKKNNSGEELWVSDGTVNGTEMVKDINSSSASMPNGFFAFQGWVFFAAEDGVNGIELWTSNGTESGTYLIENINGSDGGYYGDHLIHNNELYFTGVDGSNGVSLWKVVNFSGIDDQGIPTDNAQLFQNYPNPFTSQTTIRWETETNAIQTLKVLDILGNEVALLADEYMPAGSYSHVFDAEKLPAGIYFLTLQNDQGLSVRKIVKQ
jgi:ELWxxDGT repeat protein